MSSVEEGDWEPENFANKTARRSEQFVSISVADLFLAATLLAALFGFCVCWQRLIRFLAGLSGLIALSILLTILVASLCVVITSPQW